MAVIAVADRNLMLTGRAPQPDSPVAVEVFLLDKGRISPLRGCDARAHRTASLGLFTILRYAADASCLMASLRPHRKTPPLTEVEPPTGFRSLALPSRSKISTGLDALLWAKRTASGLRKKTAPRRASLVNDFFTDAGYFCGNVRAVCVIVPPTNSTAATPPQDHKHHR